MNQFPVAIGGAFATAALGPSKAAAAPMVRAMLRRQVGAFDGDLDGVPFTVAPYADDEDGLRALRELIYTGHRLRTLLLELGGHVYSGGGLSQPTHWLGCYTQRRAAGMSACACPSVARNISTDRHRQDAGPPVDMRVPCAMLAAHAGGAVELHASATPSQQLAALADRLGLVRCPWYRGAPAPGSLPGA